MASFTIEMNKNHQKRSLSIPSKINPINEKIENELKRLSSKEETSTSASESISIGVSGLVELYGCINQSLSLPMTQQALLLRQHEKHVGELLKGCSSLLNVCSSIKDIVLQHRVATKELEDSLAQRVVESPRISSIVATYTCSRKEVINKAKNILPLLNLVDYEVLGEEDCQLSTVIKSLRCVSIINLSVFQSLLTFLSMPVSKQKRSLVSKIMSKGRGKCESGNEINDVDMVLHELVSGKSVNDEKLCFSLKKLKVVEDVTKSIENGLEILCKQLSETNVSLMNIVSF